MQLKSSASQLAPERRLRADPSASFDKCRTQMTVWAADAPDLAKTLGTGGNQTFDVYDQGRSHGSRRPDYGSIQKASQKHIQKNLALQHKSYAKLAKTYS